VLPEEIGAASGKAGAPSRVQPTTRAAARVSARTVARLVDQRLGHAIAAGAGKLAESNVAVEAQVRRVSNPISPYSKRPQSRSQRIFPVGTLGMATKTWPPARAGFAPLQGRSGSFRCQNVGGRGPLQRPRTLPRSLGLPGPRQDLRAALRALSASSGSELDSHHPEFRSAASASRCTPANPRRAHGPLARGQQPSCPLQPSRSRRARALRITCGRRAFSLLVRPKRSGLARHLAEHSRAPSSGRP